MNATKVQGGDHAHQHVCYRIMKQKFDEIVYYNVN